MWAVPWKLTTVQESNDKGSWFNYAVAQEEMDSVAPEAIIEARDLYNSFRAGEIKTGTGEEKQTARRSRRTVLIPLGVVRLSVIN